MGSFHNVFVFSEEPDWEGLRRLDVRACLRGYERGGMWFLDVCPAHRLHGHVPFTEVFPSLPHQAIAPLVESLRTDNRGLDLTGVDWLGLALAVEAAGCAAVLAFGWDDEGLDFAFQVSRGKLERFLSRPEGERLISYRSSSWQTTASQESEATVLELWPRQQLALAQELGIGTLDFHFRAPLIFERGPIPGELQQPPPEERLPRLVAEKDLAGALTLLRATPDLPSRGRKLQALRDAVCSEVAGQCRQAMERGDLGLMQEALALVGEHPAEPELLPLWNRLQLSLGEGYLAAGQASRALEPLRGIIRLTGMVTEEHQVMARARELRPVAARQACSQLGVQASPIVGALLADTQTSLETLTEALSSEETAWDCPRGVYAFESSERGLYGLTRFTPASVELDALVMVPHQAWFRITLARDDQEGAARRLSEAAFYCFQAGRPEYALVLTERALQLDPQNEVAGQSLNALRARGTRAPEWARLCLTTTTFG